MPKISKDGQDWMVLALDPFHDQVRPIEGLVDEYTAPSFVRCHVQQATFSATADGDKFRVLFNGMHAPERAILATFDACRTGIAHPATYIHPITVQRSPAASDPNYSNAAMVNLGGFPTTPTRDIPSRLVAIGIEVTDVTQRLYQQGVIGVARVGGDCSPAQNPYTFALGANQGCMMVETARAPAVPGSRTLAGMVPGWVEWEAAKGVYAVPKFNKPAPPAAFVVGGGANSYVHHNYEFQEVIAEGQIARWCTRTGDTWNIAADWGTPFYSCGMVPSGFDPLAIFIEGVDANAQFRVSVKTYVEYFPDSANATALASATGSPAYDPIALLSYHVAAIRLPAGVPVSLNAKGDWWRMVKSALARVGDVAFGAMALSPHVAAFMGQPELAAALHALNMATTQLRVKGKPAPSKAVVNVRNIRAALGSQMPTRKR